MEFGAPGHQLPERKRTATSNVARYPAGGGGNGDARQTDD